MPSIFPSYFLEKKCKFKFYLTLKTTLNGLPIYYYKWLGKVCPEEDSSGTPTGTNQNAQDTENGRVFE
jgi:hypothetical protein